ncbi:7alpha-hydroxysteroid dehydrogenase [Ligilactobacillus cholophilus]|uniref:7alpha-hydroxysteroid dehydrogenase n=1 Tax=Ligilactobacillus cholophilus TaxID=3050131 RepID=UPI0025AFC047|nr:SDR family NAD(P)-dependent oxidoreductase [Ligilactobacillus cholophilus]
MTEELNGKVALVTAASRGIGLAITKELVENGAIVYMAVRDSEKNRNLTAELHAENDKFRSVIYNAFDFDTYEPMIEKVVEEAGHLDILVNNFGTTDIQKDTTLADGDSEVFFDIVNKNIASVYYTSKYAVKAMRTQENGGNIINISSIAGTTPDISRLAYGVSKAAINSLTQQTAVEYARNKIRANAILPGFVGTDGALQNMSKSFLDGFLKNVPLNEIVKPEDIANLVVFLASDKSRYITGELIPVAGGFGLPTPIYGDVVNNNIQES